MDQHQPLQNRVTPFGEIVAVPQRGSLMGNRGKLHDDSKTLSQRRWARKQWVTCRLDHKGRRRTLMAPDSYTELFFLDEATALAAGHRPCGECRPERYRAFVEAWSAAHRSENDARKSRSISEIDRELHSQRVDARTRKQRRWQANIRTLPTGTIIEKPNLPGVPWLVVGNRLLRWSFDGYQEAKQVRPDEAIDVLTPAGTVMAIAGGYNVDIHPSATELEKL